MNKKYLSILVIVFSLFWGLYKDELGNTYSVPVEGNLEVYFLDVGQADSILIRNNDDAMLIDAGNNEDGKLLVDYFKKLGITNFSYVVGTHPHEDHICGLDDIINNFNINNIYLPNAITTTKTFSDIIDAMDNNNLMYKVPRIGDVFSLGDAVIEVIYTGTDTSDLNNTSIVLRLDYGETSFLFTGDATDKTEKLILNKNIDVDILKVGHHGSKYSTIDEFLNKVNPEYAIISVGIPNSYGHPSNETITKLNNKNIDIYRTDKKGTIVISTDGNNINITNMKTNLNG